MSKQIENRIQNSFNEVVPDPIHQIKSDPRFRVPEKPSGFSLSSLLNKKVYASILSILLLAVILITSLNQLTEPVVASTITFDINPSIVVTLDEDDNVINATGLNDDGNLVISRDIKVKGLSIDEFIDLLVLRLEETNYILSSDDDYNIILISVENNDNETQELLKTKIQTRLNSKLEQYNQNHWVLDGDSIPTNNFNLNQFKTEHNLNNQSNARVALIYRISELQDLYSIDELSAMSIKDLYSIYLEHEDTQFFPNYDKMPKPRR
jgi:hypothetical protein